MGSYRLDIELKSKIDQWNMDISHRVSVQWVFFRCALLRFQQMGYFTGRDLPSLMTWTTKTKYGEGYDKGNSPWGWLTIACGEKDQLSTPHWLVVGTGRTAPERLWISNITDVKGVSNHCLIKHRIGAFDRWSRNRKLETAGPSYAELSL